LVLAEDLNNVAIGVRVGQLEDKFPGSTTPGTSTGSLKVKLVFLSHSYEPTTTSRKEKTPMKRIKIAALSFCLGLLSLPFVRSAHADEGIN
jgi:hypothetical protein